MLKLFSALIIGALALGTVPLALSPSSAAPALAPRTSDAAGVRVVVTPKTLRGGAAAWEFEVVMDTHTKPLNEDLAAISVLVDDVGKRYTPLAWQGDQPGGHHRKGVLQFTAPADMPAAIELRIDGVGGAGTRSFRWELK